ncbi:MAG TPA: hypothetical protein DDW90_08205 [Cyanobacteria bacterium UBA9971]|nr:MAG: hypothetical protein UR95_C0010G0008 [Parcubacteria group bacterium GW2011_GWC1_36_108]HBG49466.1 hypothetical protein [Cyanobacteria bacterium UBA9971]HCR36139.1 hypothetical protein [Candidatus Woesebacteria bacterium]
MRTITVRIYTFDELNDKSKEKAIGNLSDINISHEWWDYTFEDAENIGLKISAFDIGRGSYVKGKFIYSAAEVAANILRDHGEKCDTYRTAEDFLTTWQPVFNDYMDEEHENYESRESEDKLQEIEEEFLRSLCEDYRIMLQKNYEYLTSGEAIIETIQANEYEFTENGELY